MHGARLAKKAGAELREHFACREQYAPEAVGILRVISCMHGVLIEGDAVCDLARRGGDLHINAEFAQRDHHIFVELGDAHRLEDKLTEMSVACPDPQHMVDKIEIDLKPSAAPRDWRRGQPARGYIKRHMP